MNFLNKGQRFFQKLQMIESLLSDDFSSERPLVNELLTVIPTAFIYEEDCNY